MRGTGAGAAAVGALLAMGAIAAGAPAATINVHPGSHALRRAIQHAHRGDTLRLHHGRYKEHVKIDKRLTLKRAPGESRPVIDARCNANDTIKVTHGGVTLAGLEVVGAGEGHGSYPSEVYFVGVPSGEANGLVVRDTCDAEYGINLFHTGPLKVQDSSAKGFIDSGIYVGGITNTLGGRLEVKRNELFGNSRGVIVEDTDFDADVRLSKNDVHGNTVVGSDGPSDGFFLRNTDGIYLVANQSRDNGASGYHADSNSDENVFSDNVASGNSDGAFNNEGADNCGSGNDFITIPC